MSDPGAGETRKLPSIELVQRMRRKASILRQSCRPAFVKCYGADDEAAFAQALEDGARALEVADQELAALLASAPAPQAPKDDGTVQSIVQEMRRVIKESGVTGCSSWSAYAVARLTMWASRLGTPAAGAFRSPASGRDERGSPVGDSLFHRRHEDGSCDCPYCRGDAEELAELAANYELDLHAVREKYNELILQVGNAYPGESRHQTALRYIRERESRMSTAASAAPTPDSHPER